MDEIAKIRMNEQIRQLQWGRENWDDFINICCAGPMDEAEFDRLADILLSQKLLILFFVFSIRQYEHGLEKGLPLIMAYINEENMDFPS